MYKYTEQRPNLFTEEGMLVVMKIRDNVRELLATAGAFRSENAWRGVSGDTWLMMAALDYLVQLDVIREISSNTPGQYRVFVKA